MERWQGRVAVVTGTSAGIGAAVAYQLQDAGVTVVALARRVDKIKDAVEAARKGAKSRNREQIGKASTPGKLHCVKCDVSKEEDILAAFKWIKDNLGRVDILINNAGVGGKTKLSDTNSKDWKQIMDVNVLGLSYCTREALQLMKAQNIDDGHIIHINSGAGHAPPPASEAAMYYVSKHGVTVLTEGLRKELVAAKSKIRVTSLSPGVVRTEFFNDLTDDLEQWWALHNQLNAEDVADAALYILSVPPHVQIHELTVKPVGALI